MAFWSGWFNGIGSTAGERNKGAQSTGTGNLNAAVPVTNDTALQLSSVWGCVKIIQESVAGMEVNFYSKNENGTLTLEPDYPLANIFNYSANKNQTGLDFKSTMTFSGAMQGNAYALKQFGIAGANRGRVIGLIPLMPAQMLVTLDANGTKVFDYTASGKTVRYSQDQIWHVMFNSSNGVVGLSPLEYGARAMGISIAAENRVSSLAKNGFKPTGVLTTDKVLTPDQREQIRGQFDHLTTGQGDQLQVLEAGFDYTQVSLSPKDVQLLESRTFQIEDIARFWNVPAVLLNNPNATAWGSGIQQIIEAFYKFGIRPYLDNYEASIERNLIPIEDKNKIVAKFDFDALLRSDKKTRVESATASIQGGLTTINEERAKEGMPPVDGGNEPYIQSQNIPLSQAKEGAQNVTEKTT